MAEREHACCDPISDPRRNPILSRIANAARKIQDCRMPRFYRRRPPPSGAKLALELLITESLDAAKGLCIGSTQRDRPPDASASLEADRSSAASRAGMMTRVRPDENPLSRSRATD